MTTAKEVLALIITGDGRGAISEIDKVGNAAERELGRSQSNLDQMGARLTTYGATAVGAGALAAAGLYGAAMAAGNLDTNVQRIEGTFGSAAAGAVQFVENANGIGLADQQAAQYVANIGELAVGLGIGTDAAAGMTTETVRLVAQLALIKGQSPAEALEAVSAGLIGEYDSLQRLVPSISAAAIQERALADTRKASAKDLTAAEKATATFAIINESATETLARSGDITDSAAYRNAVLAASYGDMKTQLGEGALPVLEKTVGVLTGAAGVFDTANTASGGLVSSLATYATVTALAGGGLAFVVGQGIKARDVFTDLDGPLRNSEGGLTRTGKAAATVGTALAAIAVTQAGLEALNSLQGTDRKITDDVNATIAATEDGEQALSRFRSAVDEQMRGFNLTDGPRWLAAELGVLNQAMLDIGSEEFSRQTSADVQAVFDEITARAPATAAVVLDAFERQNEALDHNSREYRNNKAFIDRNRESLHLQAAATNQASTQTNQLTTDLTRSSQALEQHLDPVLAVLDAKERLTDAEKRMADAANTSSRDIQQANRSLSDARDRVTDATQNLTDAQRELNDVLNDDPMFGLRSVSPEEELADARQRLAQANQMLAQNPGNAVALTMRDEAIMDLEAASKRQQEQKRNAEQRADDIAAAQRAVVDAQRGLDDANQGVADAQARLAEVQSQHGLNSDAYREAAQEVIEANLAVQSADGELADYLAENGTAAVAEMNSQLDQWIAKGGPVAEAAAVMKAAIAPLTAEALALAGALTQAGTSSIWAFQLLFHPELGPAAGPATNGRRGPNSANPGQPTKVDQFGIPLYGRAAGGEIPGTGTGTSDDVLVAASAGEFMLKKTTVTALGPSNVALLNQTGRWPELPSQRTAPVSNVTREGDLVIEKVLVQLQAIDDQLAGAAVVRSLRNVARRSGRGLRADRKLV